MMDGRRLTFGVSGILYRRNLIFYDVETGSLWSQLLSKAVAGPLAGKKLKVLRAEDSTWSAWRALHPGTLVLSFATGVQRDYHGDPYASYPLSRNPALLVALGGSVKIYPYSELKKGDPRLLDHVGGQEITIIYDRVTQTAWVENQPTEVSVIVGYLDDLKAFYPHAQVYRRPRH
jgi:uncharacterized protein DUF3179